MMLPFLMILNLGMQLLETLDERVLLQGISLLAPSRVPRAAMLFWSSILGASKSTKP